MGGWEEREGGEDAVKELGGIVEVYLWVLLVKGTSFGVEVCEKK